MYIRLTRLDNSPIWINAAFIVTVEPRKGGGSIVVPIGDGLDYDVRETAENVLAMIGEAPSPVVVPVPAPKGLAPTRPDDVSPEAAAPDAQVASVPPASQVAPVPQDVPAAPVAPAAPDVFANAVTEPEPPKKPARKTATRKTTRKTRKPAMPFEADQVDRLVKMAPKSLPKLKNTLVTQFKIDDANVAVEALAANGVLTLDGDHVVWTK